MSINISLLLSNMNDRLSGYKILGFQYISLKSLLFISLTYLSNCGNPDISLNFFPFINNFSLSWRFFFFLNFRTLIIVFIDKWFSLSFKAPPPRKYSSTISLGIVEFYILFYLNLNFSCNCSVFSYIYLWLLRAFIDTLYIFD